MAIRNLQVRSGSHIDKGLLAALRELQSPRHRRRKAQVLMLLTDGVQTGTPGQELRAGNEVRTAAGRYYFAPDSGDLGHIYGEIARDSICPDMELWGGR